MRKIESTLAAALSLAVSYAAGAQTNALPDDPRRALVVRACTGCHPPETIAQKRRTADEWDELIAKMVDRGAVATEQEQEQIFAYLVKYLATP
jgi:cytochrome c553